jgi:peroxiredoxin
MTQYNGMLAPGDQAPDFTLPAGPDRSIRLAELRGAPVIMVFYPADWSPVCSDQAALYQAMSGEFERYHAALLGLSVDGVWCHRAFAEQRGIRYPLLSDFQPKGDVASQFGVYNDAEGISERALFVLDGDGVVVWSYMSPRETNPGADGILTALDATQER